MSLDDLSESDQRVYATISAIRDARSQKTRELSRVLFESKPADVDITEATLHHMVVVTHNMEILQFTLRRGALFRIAYDHADLLSDDLGPTASLESAPHTIYFPRLHMFGAYTDDGYRKLRDAWKAAIDAGVLSKDEQANQVLVTGDAFRHLLSLGRVDQDARAK